jgi:hypothetical protein
MTATEAERAVLDFYAREARGIPEPTTLAGLRLSAFKSARSRLVAKGSLVRDVAGRYLPVEAVTG